MVRTKWRLYGNGKCFMIDGTTTWVVLWSRERYLSTKGRQRLGLHITSTHQVIKFTLCIPSLCFYNTRIRNPSSITSLSNDTTACFKKRKKRHDPNCQICFPPIYSSSWVSGSSSSPPGAPPEYSLDVMG